MAMNIDLKNLNVNDLKDQILKAVDKKTLIKIGIAFGAIILFLIIYYLVVNPIVKNKKAQVDDMNKKKSNIVKMTNDLSSMKKQIKKLQPEYDKYSRLFHSKA